MNGYEVSFRRERSILFITLANTGHIDENVDAFTVDSGVNSIPARKLGAFESQPAFQLNNVIATELRNPSSIDCIVVVQEQLVPMELEQMQHLQRSRGLEVTYYASSAHPSVLSSQSVIEWSSSVAAVAINPSAWLKMGGFTEAVSGSLSLADLIMNAREGKFHFHWMGPWLSSPTINESAKGVWTSESEKLRTEARYWYRRPLPVRVTHVLVQTVKTLLTNPRRVKDLARGVRSAMRMNRSINAMNELER
jgi:hypothetical protein